MGKLGRFLIIQLLSGPPTFVRQYFYTAGNSGERGRSKRLGRAKSLKLLNQARSELEKFFAAFGNLMNLNTYCRSMFWGEKKKSLITVAGNRMYREHPNGFKTK